MPHCADLSYTVHLTVQISLTQFTSLCRSLLHSSPHCADLSYTVHLTVQIYLTQFTSLCRSLLHSSPHCADLPDACISGNYTELDDHKRDVNNMHDEYLCDRDSLVPGWYRFLINGTSASMPTDCPPASLCHHHWSS